MKILYVCHRFPFPPKRGGKIRPFNMIRHLHASARGDGVLARALGRRRRGRRRASPRTARVSRWPSCAIRVQVAAHGRAAADADAVVDRLLPLAAHLRGASARSLATRALRPDLRALLVGRAVRRARRAASRRSSTSATWIRRSGSNTRSYKPFPLSLGYWLEGAKLDARGEAARARASISARRRRAPNGRRCEGYGTGAPTRLVSQRRRQPSTSRRPASRTIPTRSASSAAWTTTRTRNACSSSARNVLPLLRRRRPGCKLFDRRRRSVARGAPARRAARRHGHRLGARRAAVRAPLGADGRAAQHRARHAEQDPRGDGDGRAGRREPRSPPAASMRSPASISWSRDARGIRGRDPAHPRATPTSARVSPVRAATRMLLAPRLGRSMQRLDGIIERCLETSAATARNEGSRVGDAGAISPGPDQRNCARTSTHEHQHLRSRLRRRRVARLPRARRPQVIGVDIDRTKLDLIAAGKTPVVEEGMVELMRERRRRAAACA